MGKIVAGPETGYFSTIPYVKFLPDYPFDNAVVSEGTYSQRLDFLRALLPEVLSDAGYAQHWKMLLHAEEHQMRYDIVHQSDRLFLTPLARQDMEVYTMYDADLELKGKAYL